MDFKHRGKKETDLLALKINRPTYILYVQPTHFSRIRLHRHHNDYNQYKQNASMSLRHVRKNAISTLLIISVIITKFVSNHWPTQLYRSIQIPSSFLEWTIDTSMLSRGFSNVLAQKRDHDKFRNRTGILT
jgi:hypothetical protein